MWKCGGEVLEFEGECTEALEQEVDILLHSQTENRLPMMMGEKPPESLPEVPCKRISPEGLGFHALGFLGPEKIGAGSIDQGQSEVFPRNRN